MICDAARLARCCTAADRCGDEPLAGVAYGYTSTPFGDLTEDMITPNAGSYDVVATPGEWMLAAAGFRGR